MSASETCELTFKDGMSGSEKDAGFCSGEDENFHSPSGSEDSVEVQISPISLRNKRKLAEPKKALKSDPNRPLKKRRLIERSSSPFRPWSSPEKEEEDRWKIEEERRREEEVQRLYEAQIHAQVLARLQVAAKNQELDRDSRFRTAISHQDSISRTATPHPEAGLRAALQTDVNLHTANLQQGAISRTDTPHLESNFRTVVALQSDSSLNKSILPSEAKIHTATLDPGANIRTATPHQNSDFRPGAGLNPDTRFSEAKLRAATLEPSLRTATSQKRSLSPTFRLKEDSAHQNEPLALVLREGRVPPYPGVTDLPYDEKKGGKIPSSRMSSTSGAHSEQSTTGHSQRNYKNMTRERRIEANARERTRVHTISAAFNTLRRSIPAYSHNQKLSKLSVLRIACSYIMTLSKIVREGEDSGLEGGNGVELGECVDLVSRTIQTEGKLRKKKDE